MIAQAQHGTDALIELCITGDFGVLPVQVSLFGAMDTPAEAVLPDAEQMLMGYGLTQGGGPIAGKQRYAEACIEELGDIPFFADLGGGQYGTYDCRDGVEIPVRVTPKTGTDSQGQPVFGATTIAAVTPSTCDEPQHLDYYGAASSSSYGYGCEVGARVSHAQNSRGTDWVLLCRNVVDATAGKYNDIAMIGKPEHGQDVLHSECALQQDRWDGRRAPRGRGLLGRHLGARCGRWFLHWMPRQRPVHSHTLDRSRRCRAASWLCGCALQRGGCRGAELDHAHAPHRDRQPSVRELSPRGSVAESEVDLVDRGSGHDLQPAGDGVCEAAGADLLDAARIDLFQSCTVEGGCLQRCRRRHR